MPSPHHGRSGTRARRAPDLRAFVPPADTALRPPWSRAGDAFDRACTQCAKCVDACPTHVLRLANGRLRVDYADGECTFCGACATACPEPAFDLAASDGVKARLRDHVEIARDKGVFGAPSFITEDGELFWGHDRLDQALDWAVKHHTREFA